MYASRVLRVFVRAVPAVLVALLAAATFAVAGGVASAAPMPLPSIDSGGVTRLAIAPGQNSVTGQGSVVANKIANYSIGSVGGQRLIFDITSNNGQARVTVAPLIGGPIAADVPHAEVVADGLDYQIYVSSADGSPSDFTLTVTAA